MQPSVRSWTSFVVSCCSPVQNMRETGYYSEINFATPLLKPHVFSEAVIFLQEENILWNLNPYFVSVALVTTWLACEIGQSGSSSGLVNQNLKSCSEIYLSESSLRDPDAQDIWEPLWSNLIKSPPSRGFLRSRVCTPQSAAEGLNFNNLNVVSNYNLRVGFQITMGCCCFRQNVWIHGASYFHLQILGWDFYRVIFHWHSLCLWKLE